MNDSPLARYFVPLRRWWWAIAATVFVALAVVFVTSPDAPPTEADVAAEATAFRATHLLIRNDEAPTQLSFDLIRLFAGQGDLTNRIAEQAGDELGPQDVEQVELIPDDTTGTMSVTAIRPSTEEAAALATTYALELVAFLDERTRTAAESDLQRITGRINAIEPEVDQLQQDIDQLPEDDIDRQILTAELDGLLGDFSALRSQQRALEDQLQGEVSSFLTLEEPSPVPVSSESEIGEILQLPVDLRLRLLLVAIVAAIAAAAGVLFFDLLDTRVRTRREAETAFGLPVLAELPRRSRRAAKAEPLPALTHAGGVSAEVLRALRLSLSLAPTWQLTSLSRDADGPVGSKTAMSMDGDLRSLVVTSPRTGDGKSTLVANLAVSLAEGGKRVLVVDCDFRRPAVGDLLGIEGGLGLRDLAHLAERPLLDLASPTIAPNVAMVRSGSIGVTPSWFMASAGKLVEACLDVADVVIFDTGPITLTNEASALLPHVDTSLLVVRAGKVATDQARGTVEQLTQVSASVSGIVLVGSEARRRYGYGYYTAESAGKGEGSSVAVGGTGTSPAVESERGRDMWQALPGEDVEVDRNPAPDTDSGPAERETPDDETPNDFGEYVEVDLDPTLDLDLDHARREPPGDEAPDDLGEYIESSGRGTSS